MGFKEGYSVGLDQLEELLARLQAHGEQAANKGDSQ